MRRLVCVVFAVILAIFSFLGCNNSEKNNETSITVLPTTTQSSITQPSTTLPLTTILSTTSPVITPETTKPEPSQPSTIISNGQLVIKNLAAKNAIIFDVNKNKEIYSKDADSKISIASITKIMTACVALEYMDSNDVLTVGSELDYVNKGSSICQLKEGFKLKLYDLISGMLMVSGNDAAYTIAVNVSRKVSGKANMSDEKAITYFCDEMNKYAKKIGMKNTHFSNPDGWDDEGNYSTVNDLVILIKHAMNIKEIKEISACAKRKVVFESGQNITWKNTNLLLDKNGSYYRANVTGMKTGTTENAGNCLAVTYENGKRSIIILVMGCETNELRYSSAICLIDELEKVL